MQDCLKYASKKDSLLLVGRAKKKKTKLVQLFKIRNGFCLTFLYCCKTNETEGLDVGEAEPNSNQVNECKEDKFEMVAHFPHLD